jgi:hypothetical protein
MPCGKYFGVAAIDYAGSTEVWLFEDSMRETRDEALRVAHARMQTALSARQRHDQDR